MGKKIIVVRKKGAGVPKDFFAQYDMDPPPIGYALAVLRGDIVAKDRQEEVNEDVDSG